MTSNNKVGSNVDLFCKHYRTDLFLTKLGLTWLERTRPGLTKESSTKQLYLSLKYKGLGNAMNYLKDHVIYYNAWLGRDFAFYNHSLKALVDNNYTKGHNR